MQNIINGVINFIFTFITIVSIDKMEHKKLILYRSFLLFLIFFFICSIFIGLYEVVWFFFFVLGFIAVYSATIE
jgi:hypothetical protein